MVTGKLIVDNIGEFHTLIVGNFIVPASTCSGVYSSSSCAVLRWRHHVALQGARASLARVFWVRASHLLRALSLSL